MSSFLCFICHSTVNADTNEEMREKYREVVGMNLCPDSHLCHICCHVMNRLWLFRSVCLKRSLEYPVLFSEKGTLNLQRNDLEIHTVCFEDCEHYKSRNINSKYYHFTYFDGTFDSNQKYNLPNDYVELEDERQEFDELRNNNVNYKCDNEHNNIHSDQFNENYDYSHNESLEVHDNEFVPGPTEFDYDLKGTQTNTKIDQNFPAEDLEPKYDDVCDDTGQNLDCDDEDVCDDDVRSQYDITEPNHCENVIKEDIKSPVNIESNNLENIEDVDTEKRVKKKKKKKKKHKEDKDEKETKRFDKFLLSMEEQKAELEAKRKDKKYIEAEFKCYNCAIGFLFKDTYQAHMMRHEESNGEHQCAVCGLRFATPGVLRAHAALHAERHRCARCGLALRRRQRADHQRLCHRVEADPAACHLCGRVFKHAAALQQHLRRVHRTGGARAPACGVCGQRCRDPAAVRNHMIKHLSRRFPCAMCARTFGSPAALRAHAAAHAPPARQLCDCGAVFDSRRALRDHRRRSKLHAEASFECPVCARACPSAGALRAHVRGVHARRALACATCGARAGSRRQLARHQRLHAPAAPAPPRALCHLCGANFKGNSKLNRHLREVCERDKLEEELSSYYTQAADTGHQIMKAIKDL